MGRKVIFVSLLLFVEPGTILQIVVGIFVASVFLAAHIRYQPFLDRNDDNLQGLSLGSTVMTLLGAAILLVASITSEDDSVLATTILIVMANVIVAVYALYMMTCMSIPQLVQSRIDKMRRFSEKLEETEKAKALEGSVAREDHRFPEFKTTAAGTAVVVDLFLGCCKSYNFRKL